MVFKFAQVLAGACLVVLMAHAPAALAQSGRPWVDPPADINTGSLAPDPQANPSTPDNPPPFEYRTDRRLVY